MNIFTGSIDDIDANLLIDIIMSRADYYDIKLSELRRPYPPTNRMTLSYFYKRSALSNWSLYPVDMNITMADIREHKINQVI